MSEELENRRRRAAWRASHRGTKELDLMIGRFAAEKLPGMDEGELSRFEAFLAVPDPELQDWLMAPLNAAAGEFAALVSDVRQFNGLK